MKTSVTAPNLVCIIECRKPGHVKPREIFSIEQYYEPSRGTRGRDSVLNQVEATLNDLHEKTGLLYDLVYWADPERAYGLYPDAEREV